MAAENEWEGWAWGKEMDTAFISSTCSDRHDVAGERQAAAQARVRELIKSSSEAGLREILREIPLSDLDDGFFLGMAVAWASGSGQDLGCLRALLDAGAPIDSPISEGYTALSRAADGGDAESIHALCSLGANIETRDEAGRTPLMLAAACANEMAIFALLELGASALGKDLAARTAVDMLLSAGEWRPSLEQREADARCLAALMRAGGLCSRTASMSMMAQIAITGNAAMLAAATETGVVAVDDASKSGATALMCCASHQLSSLDECAKALLELGARTDLADNKGITALDYAMEGGNHVIADLIRKAVAAREAFAISQAAGEPEPHPSRRMSL